MKQKMGHLKCPDGFLESKMGWESALIRKAR